MLRVTSGWQFGLSDAACSATRVVYGRARDSGTFFVSKPGAEVVDVCPLPKTTTRNVHLMPYDVGGSCMGNYICRMHNMGSPVRSM